MKYDDKQCFIHKIRVRYSDLFEDGKIGPVQIVKYIQDLAVEHSNHIGYGTEFLRERHLAWLLLYWDIDIYRLPADEEELTGMTWSRKHKHIQADRDSEILDENGGPVCYASARWVITDIAKRRPYKMPQDFFLPYLFPDPRPIKEPDYSFPPVDEELLFSEREFTVTRRDMDNNDHVNNSIYVEWAMDDVDDDTWACNRIKKIKVAYKHELRRGARVLTKYYLNKDHPGGMYTTSMIFDKEDPGTMCTMVTFFWGPKEDSA